MSKTFKIKPSISLTNHDYALSLSLKSRLLTMKAEQNNAEEIINSPEKET